MVSKIYGVVLHILSKKRCSYTLLTSFPHSVHSFWCKISVSELLQTTQNLKKNVLDTVYSYYSCYFPSSNYRDVVNDLLITVLLLLVLPVCCWCLVSNEGYKLNAPLNTVLWQHVAQIYSSMRFMGHQWCFNSLYFRETSVKICIVYLIFKTNFLEVREKCVVVELIDFWLLLMVCCVEDELNESRCRVSEFICD